MVRAHLSAPSPFPALMPGTWDDVTSTNATPTGTVLNVGADWRLTDAQGVIRPDARYAIRTDDGANIVVVTEGFPLPGGRTMLRGKFETSRNGTYSWLNDVVGVGVLKRNGTSAVRIDMWHVSGQERS
jgi:hypothetical protein